MSRYENAAVPFVLVGNKQALTDKQLAEQPWLSEFMQCFAHCFERSEAMQCFFFYSDGVPRNG